MASAGGEAMPMKGEARLQYHVREPMYDPDPEFVMGTATGAVSLTWTSRSGDEGGDGRVYVDGSDVAACLDIGDEVKMSAEGAPRLLLYDKAGDAATTE